MPYREANTAILIAQMDHDPNVLLVGEDLGAPASRKRSPITMPHRPGEPTTGGEVAHARRGYPAPLSYLGGSGDGLCVMESTTSRRISIALGHTGWNCKAAQGSGALADRRPGTHGPLHGAAGIGFCNVNQCYTEVCQDDIETTDNAIIH